MSLAEVERIALELSENERGLLAARLLDSVAPDSLAHGADELERREREMGEGIVEEISYEELLNRVKAERGRCG
jgi:hypothetical protein